ncbi:MAG: N-acetylneuraminate synthase [Verrucomicrobia bacterium]|nr:N-acetylneuraminate synthase [Verrucomicrobiota bacterium]
MQRLNFGHSWVSSTDPTYFVADISANHDGDLQRALDLIHLAKASGANAVKFQNFRAPKIVSEHGFAEMQGRLSHQAQWKKSVYEVYQAASLPWEWTPVLKQESDKAGIDFLSTPYDLEAIEMLDPHLVVFKVGSGDITWLELLKLVASKGKPVILATGASDLGDVQRAVHVIRSINPQLVLMQCNTNYTGSIENFKHIHLNVLKTFQTLYPDVILGLSDHTPGCVTALGAVALGARVIEKHFTDDTQREGPDHPFSMTPTTWCEMVERTREMEYALGSTEKRIASNEEDTAVIQRRCLRAARNLAEGTVIDRTMIDVLRPAPKDAIFPYEIERIVGLRLRQDVLAGEHFQWTSMGDAD